MLEKLKREWKTFSLAIATVIVGFWDAGASAFDFAPLVPPEYSAYVPLVLGIAFLVLRKYKDSLDA